MKVLILTNNDVGLYKFRKELIEELLNPGCYILGRNDNPVKYLFLFQMASIFLNLKKWVVYL